LLDASANLPAAGAVVIVVAAERIVRVEVLALLVDDPAALHVKKGRRRDQATGAKASAPFLERLAIGDARPVTRDILSARVPEAAVRTDNETPEIEIGANFAAPSDMVVVIAFRIEAIDADVCLSANSVQ
jgi:hypothetical protein